MISRALIAATIVVAGTIAGWQHRLPLYWTVCPTCWVESSEAVQQRLPGWQLETFSAATVSANRSQVRVTSAPPSGGLFLRREVSDGPVRQLTFKGQGNGTLRITLGDGVHGYRPAPSGTLTMPIDPAQPIEVLIYADGAFEYVIESVSVDPCPACVTDARLREIVLRDVPGLDRERSAFERARLLLDWTAHIVDEGRDVPRFAGNDSLISSVGAGEAYQEIWLPDAGGALCGGYSVFFAKVLALFGFDAYTIDMGDADARLTHVTTLVFIDGRFYIFDATLNGYYVRGDRPASLDEVLSGTTTLLLREVRRTAVWPSPRGGDCRAVNDYYVCHDVDTTALTAEEWRPHLIAFGLDPDEDWMPSLMRHRVYSVTGSGPHREALVEVLGRHGISETGY